GIDYDRRNIVRIMNTQKAASISIKNKEKDNVIVRTCSRPSQEVIEFYRALKMSSIPFKAKKFVVRH
ncbi:MAG: family transposase, partial [Bacteroidota bacterium]|nr:family transposase [Bacteroidota bacterium]